jgi:hypothetical protein
MLLGRSPRVCTSRVSLVSAAGALVLLGALGACAKTVQEKTQATLTVRPIPGRPLSSMEGKDLVFLPTAYLRSPDYLKWTADIKNPHEYLRHADSLFQDALTQHAYKIKWVFASQLRRASDRSAGMIQDPDNLSEQQLLPGLWKANAPLYDPLAEQVRSVISAQNARYVVAPVEIRFVTPREAAGASGPPPADSVPHVQVAVLRLALLDAEGTYVVWGGDVVSDTARTADAATASLATKLGELLKP